MPDVRWPREWEADTISTLPCVRSRACRSFALVQVAVPSDESGPDIDGLIARLGTDPAEVERLQSRLREARKVAVEINTRAKRLYSRYGRRYPPDELIDMAKRINYLLVTLAERGGDVGTDASAP